MNLLKALAKMTKIASGLQDSWDYTLGELETLREKYDDTVRVATERDTQVKQLQAKLHAAEQAVGDMTKRCTAVDKLNDLGYAWSVPDGRWFDPVPKPPIGVPPAMPDLPSVEYDYSLPPKPEGPRWRDFSKAPPKNMGEVVEAVLINGNSVTCPADELTWDSSLTVGVAWWRYPRDEAPVPLPPLDWPKQATHFLHNPKSAGDQYQFAEFHEGAYYHLPARKSEPRDWEWDRRGTMTVAEGAWKIVEVRK